MSYQLYLNHELISNPDFKTINLAAVTKLVTNDVAHLEVDLVTGSICINSKPAMRLQPYLAAGAKPIQYRRVVAQVGIYDFRLIREVAAPEHYELLTKAMNNQVLNPQEEVLLTQVCVAIAGELPQHAYEEQILGYEYSINNIKTKLEIISNTEPEIMSITAKITQTDLIARQVINTKYLRLY